jgi:hypothetical protein
MAAFELRSGAVNRPKLRRFSLALGLACLGGCGPVEYLSQVGRRAPLALKEARQHGAAEQAPYELTAAEEYLREARIQASRSSYQRAIEYGRRAEELAVRAEGIAREKNLRAGAPAPQPSAVPPPRP